MLQPTFGQQSQDSWEVSPDLKMQEQTSGSLLPHAKSGSQREDWHLLEYASGA